MFPFLRGFRPHVAAPETDLRLNFYSGSYWCKSSEMPLYPPTSTEDVQVAWHARIFRCLASTIIVQLDALEGQPQAWGPTALVVIVVCYLHRLVRPLAVHLKEVAEGANELGLLHSTTAASVQVCGVGTLTRPTPEAGRRPTQGQSGRSPPPLRWPYTGTALGHCVVGEERQGIVLHEWPR